MKTITKIEVTKETLIDHGKEALDEWRKETEIITRNTYNGDFDHLILKILRDGDIRYYATTHLDMIDEDDCECEDSMDLHEVPDDVLQHEIESRGFVLIRAQSITDAMRAQKLKELMEL